MNSRSDTVMFGILLIASMLSQGLTLVTHGGSFFTAFPENLGYFYPFTTTRYLRITALHDATNIKVIFNGTTRTLDPLQRGQSANVSFPKAAEVHELTLSTYSIQIGSNKNISVHSVSTANTTHGENIQTNVVQPKRNLDTRYIISSPNHADLIKTISGSDPEAWYQKSSFKLIIINAEGTENTVKVIKILADSTEEKEVKIPSHQLILFNANASLIKIESSGKVAVMLTHPCLEIPIDSSNCKCSMTVNQILPTRLQGQNFVVPSFPEITKSVLLMSSGDPSPSLSHNKAPLQPSPSGFMSLPDQTKSQYVKASGSVSLSLIGPGILIELIPENMFAGCFLLQFYSDTSGVKKAVVIAETSSTDRVRTQNGPVTGVNWDPIADSKYSSGVIELKDPTNVISHQSSKIAVYILEKSGTIIYGGSALAINENPDEFGCAVIPGEYEVRDERLGWTESLSLCTSFGKHLASPTLENSQIQLSEILNSSKDEDAWLGLRRSLMTTEWYWQRQTPSSSELPLPPSPPSSSLGYVHWADGQPLDSYNGLCASLSLDRDKDFKWKSEKCCKKKRPVCYKPPIILYPSSSISLTHEFI